jgi:hypothetical protein
MFNKLRPKFINVGFHFNKSNHQLIYNFLELVPAFLLASYISAPYLDFRGSSIISGYEYILVTISHYVWDFLPKCGACVFWNGYLNGGMPAFAEMHGAVLHPLVILTTLIWGVTNGSKIIAFLSIAISGIASWWTGKELGSSRIARIWISLLGVVGGHIIGRLDAGNIVLALSVATASLLLPMTIRLNKKITTRRIAVLAVLLALTWVSGQGYIQLGVIVGWFPAFLFLLLTRSSTDQTKIIAFGKSILISIVLCGIFFLPTVHFMNQMDKYTMEDFKSMQPLNYIALNFVINDPGLFSQSFLGMDGFPYEHINYIGWIPVIFAVIALFLVKRDEDDHIIGSLLLSVVLLLIFTSRESMVFLKEYIPSITKLRAFSVATNLMVPPILGLAALGFDRVFSMEWPRIIKLDSPKSEPGLSLSVKWLVLIPLLIISFKDIIPFAQNYIHLRDIKIPSQELAFLGSDNAQWSTPPNADWFPDLMADSRKVIMTDRSWNWKNRERLSGYLQLVNNPDNNPIEGRISRQEYYDVVKHDLEYFSYISSDNETSYCNSVSNGGYIDVFCDSPFAGNLIVHNYQWSGWYAWIDGKPTHILSGDWLSVNAPAGNHVYSFRYFPWDVYVGGGITIIGLIIVLFMVIKKEKGNNPNSSEPATD